LKVPTFHTSLPDLSNRRFSHFHLRVPSSLQFSKVTTKIELSFKGVFAATWSFYHLTVYHNLQLHLVIANELSLAI
jgi:hypothetical protein